MICMSSATTTVALAEIRAGLARKSLTQDQLATQLGLSRTGVYRRLRGEVAFSADELVHTAAFIGVALDTLFTAAAGPALAEGGDAA